MWASKLSVATGPTRRQFAAMFGSRPFPTGSARSIHGHGAFGQNPLLQAASLAVSAAPEAQKETWVEINGIEYATDDWHNLPRSIIAKTQRSLHLQKDHPVYITRQIIESTFPKPTFRYHNTLKPVVSTHQNFDSLGIPKDHPGRAKSDTYYINESTLLRTHTSAHQAELFSANLSPGFLISGDVYRRDEVDRSHYPVFHQLEGARMWDRAAVPNGDLPAAVWSDVVKLPDHDIEVEDLGPPFDEERNPLQSKHHSVAEAEAIAAHLKNSLELMVIEIFSRVKKAAATVDDEPLRIRWVEAYFPFTSPSWELEVYFDGRWVEVLGCGIVQQALLINAGVPKQLGWAFGIGLERIAMLLFQIPDIRLFWSEDKRFLDQFTGVSENLDLLKPFVPFSKYPASNKDVSFWMPLASPAGGQLPADPHDFQENDFMEIVRSVAGDVVENVTLVDQFTHPRTGRQSRCYRVCYRSLERTLTNRETNELHHQLKEAVVQRFGVEMR